MADISKVKLPNGNSYNVKDASAISDISWATDGLTLTFRDGATKVLPVIKQSATEPTQTDGCFWLKPKA